ncbi:TonB-dependent receptor [Pseudoalteromonas sp. Of7M-16]|uniref:TonB-dependent receptor n=1 Tax=Pseudoalteromonas sp. Of7M-16 TaxID=2917756 RepID=UPI001EF6265E|nr:TonB-dependent receptor [Pseudoalteromonas sp. Of7M-16]MCG7550043.1 TonB-dependent receptor [Pseudoalteromonas sp. Of7M-16]
MFKQSLISLSVSAIMLSTSAHAGELSGKVVDKNNLPVSNASVHLHGKSQTIKTDENGNFTISVDAASELHVSKNNFIDERLSVNPNSPFVTVTLTPSSIESIVVYASALHKSNMEMASPVTVISGDKLKNSAKPTLGETLKDLPGINASYFGPVSSSPIIRGLDGPRVKITQNGLDSSDASRIGPDHANTNDALSAEQIEVLRGPATLLYGSGAIGGVVNVVDNRIPTDIVETPNGAVDYSHDTNSNTNTVAALFEAGHDGFNFHFDGVKRKGGDYDTPNFKLPGDHDEHHEDEHGHEEGEEHGHDEHEGEEHAAEYAEKVDNTFIDSEVFNIGTSYVSDHMTVGFSYGSIETDYGIPAHSHDHGHDHDHDHGDEHDHDEEHGHDEHGHDEDGHDDHGDEDAHGHEEENHNVFARVKQDRWQALFNYSLHNNWLESIQIRAGYTDYEHAEIEAGAVGTVFKNETTELRTNFEHRIGQWHGIFGYHYSDSDYEAQGAEAFTPATSTTTHAFYVLEEREFGDFTLELGARVENYELSSQITETHIGHDDDHDEHGHEEDEHGHDHGHEEELVKTTQITDYTLDMTNVSASVGGVYTYAPGHNVAVSLSRSERAPLTAELLSNGLHIATSTYELGLGYHIEGTEIHFEPTDIEKETATNLDISFRRFVGDFGYTVNFFYNDIADFYYQEKTDYFFTSEHGLEVADHEHEGARDVYQFVSQDAKLYGLEFDVHYQINELNRVKVFGDHLRAELDNGQNLPRIPSNKLGVSYAYERGPFSADMTITRYLEQDEIASYETVTKGYTLVDASMSYDFDVQGVDMVGYLNLENLTDELGFVHSSFIKEQAPLPGRNVKLGIRAYF